MMLGVVLRIPVQYYIPMDFGLCLKERHVHLVSSSITPQIFRGRACGGQECTYGCDVRSCAGGLVLTS
jgi:hypothetical protein